MPNGAAKASAMPAGHSLRLDEHEHLCPARPEPPERHPEELVEGGDLGTATAAAEDGKLLPEREVFEQEVRATAEGAQEQGEGGNHGAAKEL